MLRALLLPVPLWLAACDKPAAKPAPDAGKTETPPPTPTITRECQADADCVQTRRTLEGDTQCCHERGREAVDATSYKAFGAWCDAQGKDCPKMRRQWAPLGPPVCVEGACNLGEPLPADD